jgi:hypothetical protein
LVNDGNITNLEYYFDPIHLGQAARPLMLLEFRNKKIKLDSKSYQQIYIYSNSLLEYFKRKARLTYQSLVSERIRQRIAELRKRRHIDFV